MGRRKSQKRLGKTWSCTPDQLPERHRWARRGSCGRGTKSTQGHWAPDSHICTQAHVQVHTHKHIHMLAEPEQRHYAAIPKVLSQSPTAAGSAGLRVPRRQSQCLLPGVQPQRWGSLAGGCLQGQWGRAQLKPHVCDIIKVVNMKAGACFLQKPLLPREKDSPAIEVPEDHQWGGRMECCVGDCVTEELS